MAVSTKNTLAKADIGLFMRTNTPDRQVQQALYMKDKEKDKLDKVRISLGLPKHEMCKEVPNQGTELCLVIQQEELNKKDGCTQVRKG